MYFIGWIFKASKLREHISRTADKALSSFWDVSVKVVTPLILLVLLINDLKNELTSPYEGYSWVAIILIGRDWLLAALIISLIIAMRPWKRALQREE